MRYLCTIYNHDYTISNSHTSGNEPAAEGSGGFKGTEPSFDTPIKQLVVSGPTVRLAAARAYVRCIGRKRARLLRRHGQAPESVIAQETSPRAIAASLRKTASRIGECYQMDNFTQAWLIKVEPLAVSSSSAPAHDSSPSSPSSPRPQKIRLPHHLLWRLSCRSSPSLN